MEGDGEAHRQGSRAAPEQRLRIRGLEGTAPLAHPRRGARPQRPLPLQPDQVRGRRGARAGAQAAAERGEEVQDRADRLHHRPDRQRAAGGRVAGRDAVPRDLPTGRVTFLLSDIEDSTGLLHRVGDGYGALLGDVRRLLRRAVNAPGASRSTRARTSSSASSSGRPGPSRRRSRSSAASSRGRGRAGPPSGSGSASMRADRR